MAVRLRDGATVWSAERPTHVSPAIGDGVLVVALEQELVGLRAGDAALLWTTDVGSRLSAPLVWSAGWLIASLESGEVVALRGTDGFELWRSDVAGTLVVRPSVAGTEVFVPIDDGRVIALDLTTGRQLWTRKLGGSPQEILPLDDLFVGATDNYFYRLSRSDGRMRWRWRTGGDIVGVAAVDEQRVMFVALDNILRAHDRESGVQQWRRPLKGRPAAGPQVIRDMVLVSGVAPDLRAFDTVTGADAAVLRGPGEFAAPPYVVRSPSPLAPGLIVMTGDGRLVGLLEATGPERFSLTFPPPPLLPGPELREPADVLPLGHIDLPPPAARSSGHSDGPLGQAESGSSAASPIR